MLECWLIRCRSCTLKTSIEWPLWSKSSEQKLINTRYLIATLIKHCWKGVDKHTIFRIYTGITLNYFLKPRIKRMTFTILELHFNTFEYILTPEVLKMHSNALRGSRSVAQYNVHLKMIKIILWYLTIARRRYTSSYGSTVKPVCNDHLYYKIYYPWFIQ